MRRRGRMVPTTRRGQRGLALAEVLVAFFLLFVITLAVLEMLSMAFMVNQAAGMRTELAYKAQLVVEQLRIQSAIPTANACCPLDAGDVVTLPVSSSCMATYWGPSAANIIEPEARYQIFYQVTDGPGGSRFVVVEAAPTAVGNYRYLGETQREAVGKVVRYVAEI